MRDQAGNLFGTTRAGGAGGLGTVFELANGSHAVTTLASFNGANGSGPSGGLVLDSSGDLFGTAAAGGAANQGTVFEIAADSNALTTLASFDGANGSDPRGAIALDASGNLFGAAAAGGAGAAANPGTVFELPKGSNTITALASFNGDNGSTPLGGVTLDASGNLFGTASGGGASSGGTVFEVAKGSNAVTALASFDSDTGTAPYDAPTLDAAGNLYGTASAGGTTQLGTLFKLPKGGSVVTALVPFTGSNGATPKGGVVLDPAGNLFGTASASGDGADAKGTVYELSAGSNAAVPLVAFSGHDGSQPDSGVALDPFGNLWGTTQIGGASDDGTIYEIAKGTNAVTQVAAFDDINGSFPAGGVVFDSAGNLYGAATYGGDFNDDGSVFEVAHGSNAITVLARFNFTNGANPLGGVTIDSAGNLFGTTTAGGDNSVGNIFEVATGTNAITVLASFTGPNGSVPVPTGGMALDASGNLFGTTAFSGDANDDGTVFKLPKASHTITTLAQFDGTDGANPISRVVVDSAGNLFGTADKGGDAPGDAGDGTVFEVANGSNAITALVVFNGGDDGANPTGNLVLDATGDLFGTTEAGGDTAGAAGDGTSSSSPRALPPSPPSPSSTTQTGSKPEGDIALDSAGNLYGAAQAGGIAHIGTIFELYHPAQLAFLQPPPNGIAGAALAPAVTVAVQDSASSTIRADASTVTLTLTGGTFAGGSATATATAVNGVATFPSLVINTPGNYSLTARDAAYSLSSAPAPFTISPGSQPTVQSVSVSDGSTTAGQSQRSQVRQLIITFASPATLTASQLSLSLLNTGGSGTSANGGPTGNPTPLSGVLGTPTAGPGDGGGVWVVPILANTAYSDAAGGLNDGIYTLTLTGVTGAPYTFTFHRLFGDTDGNKTVNALGFAKFKAAFGTSTGAAAYNADLDFDHNGTVNALDYGQFKKRFGLTFTYT